MTATVRTTCPYCGVGCGIEVTAGDGSPRLSGDKLHPANFGRLCSKGAAVGETLGLEGRLLYPEIQGRRADWNEALAMVARGFQRMIETDGPDTVAFYVSGQLLTEDYYVANKLMKGFIGSANIDTNSRLCMASSVAGHKRAFGSDTVPGNYEDLELADLIVLTGSNLAWCHPVLFQRIVAARGRNPRLRIVVIDPRRTATCDIADLHLALAPGTDTALFNGLLAYLDERDRVDHSFVSAYTDGFEAALASARRVSPNIAAVAEHCGLAAADIDQFYRWCATTSKVVTVYSQGVNQSSCGTDKVNAIINCHLATGSIGAPGTGPFSITGQPNAMGGREVGGFANTLAAHMEFSPENIGRVGRFWNAPRVAAKPGLKAVDMFQAVANGRIKAIWIMATNPVVSLPDADNVRTALERCPLVVVSDAYADTDTIRLADIRLPAQTWGERDGTVTNSERRISRQRAFRPAPGEARPDWWIVTEVARRMGFAEAFPYANPGQIFREHAQLSGFENNGGRDFDISGLADLEIDEYDALEPIQWPVPRGRREGTDRLFADGAFFTPDRPARFVAVGERRPGHATDADFPLVLNTGRVRDHWHTLTRTGRSARLSSHVVEPYVELHPDDAARHGIDHATLARVTSRWGEAIVRAQISETQRRGSIFVPMHWSAEYAETGRIDVVVNPVTDPVSGQPESKHTPVGVTPYRPAWHAFLLSREELTAAGSVSYRVKARSHGCWHYELAGDMTPAHWREWAQALLMQPNSQWLEYADAAAGRYRAAVVRDQCLQACLFIGPDHELPARSWLLELFAKPDLERAERLGLLAGKPPQGQADHGAIVCSCFQVGVNTLVDTIARGLVTTEAIGKTLGAGTNCGSCLPELRNLIARCCGDKAA